MVCQTGLPNSFVTDQSIALFPPFNLAPVDFLEGGRVATALSPWLQPVEVSNHG
jgi:hypothetical protein